MKTTMDEIETAQEEVKPRSAEVALERKRKVKAKQRAGLLAPYTAGIQISLRLAPKTLAKLTRLARDNYQTKSQWVSKMINEISES